MFRSGTSFNRTILELKCSSRSSLSSFVRPSIAPYWNWNYSSPRTLMTGSYLQSHHTGIEIRKFDSKRLPTYCPSIAPYWNWNEWSSSSHDLAAIPSIAPYWNWNFFLLLRRQFCHIPSIAPYWNWNSGYTAVNWLRDLPSIAPYWNWNISRVSFSLRQRYSFNRTILELKFKYGISPIFSLCAFNRTILELKYVVWRCSPSPGELLQSHHTGIEILLQLPRYSNRLPFNRTILELKSKNQLDKTIKEMPSIAPYWNWNRRNLTSKQTERWPSIAPYWNWNIIS